MASPSWLRSTALTLLGLAALPSGACAARSVNQILADPSRYQNREVRVSGSVVDSYSFGNRGAYRIQDDAAQLWVVSDQGVPRKGARVTVKGTVRNGFDLGIFGDRINVPAGLGAGLVLMESSHKAR
jgi:hypothetical protein